MQEEIKVSFFLFIIMVFLLVKVFNDVSFFFFTLSGDKKLKPLSVDEERFMRAFYEAKVQEVCSAFEFPHKIQV